MTKEEKTMLIEQHKMVWKKDSKMVDYCVNKVSDIVYLPTGIFVIDKPSIQTDFCFGYHDYEDVDNPYGYNGAQHRADNASKDVEYFIRKNLEYCGFDTWIKALGDKWRAIYLRTKYWSQTEDCKLLDLTDYGDDQRVPANADGRRLTTEERALIIKGYESAKKKFTKRLNTYLKRYGLSKVNTWTYWLDE